MRKIAVLLSGGVDSLVTARLLKDQGHDIFGIHFFTGYESKRRAQTAWVPPFGSASHAEGSTEDAGSEGNRNGRKFPVPCRAGCQTSDRADASLETSFSPPPGIEPAKTTAGVVSRLRDQLEIPIEIFDARKIFQALVVNYFVHTYQGGRTPNPCMVCNPFIKFSACLALAEKKGATNLATGHYARVKKNSDDTFHLLRGKDHQKDQSYFLARLNQHMLSRAVFPLGEFTKKETIALSRKLGLRPVVANESQDICFVKNCSYSEFLIRQPGFKAQKGFVEDIDGNVIGEHRGLHHYTIGQRRGINIPATEPYYVVRIDAEQNRLVVGFKQDVFSDTSRVEEIQWIHKVPPRPISVMTRIRYRHEAAPSLLTPLDNHTASIRFETPQSAITPGQAAVFYDGDEVLGGGWIRE